LGALFGARFDDPSSQSHRRIVVSFGVLAISALVVTPVSLVFRDGYVITASHFEDSAARRLQADWQGRAAMKRQPIVSAVGLSSDESADTRSAPKTICDNTSIDRSRDVRCAAPDKIYANPGNFEAFNRLERELRYYDTCVELVVSASCRPPLRLPNAALGTEYRMPADPPDGTRQYVFMPISAVLLILILVLLVRSVATFVLGLDMRDEIILDRSADLRPRRNRRWILLRPSVRSIRRLLVMTTTRVLDLYDADISAAMLASDKASGESALVILHVECRLSDKAWRMALLQILRGFGNRDIVLVSEIDPFHYIAQHVREIAETLEQGTAADAADINRECETWQAELGDWAIALRHAEKIRYAGKLAAIRRPDFPDDIQDLADALRIECQWSGTLRRIAASLLRRQDLGKYSWKQIVSFVLDAAEPYYRSVWDLCSRDEKLVLIQLAEEGLVNPKNTGILRRLSRRRLVALEPRFRLINESFREFVLGVEPPERVAQWEGEETMQTWKRMSVPIYAFGAMAVAILLFTEQSLVTSALAIVTGSAGVLGSLRNLYLQIRPAAAKKTP
jgi:hypothetical protein